MKYNKHSSFISSPLLQFQTTCCVFISLSYFRVEPSNSNSYVTFTKKKCHQFQQLALYTNRMSFQFFPSFMSHTCCRCFNTWHLIFNTCIFHTNGGVGRRQPILQVTSYITLTNLMPPVGVGGHQPTFQEYSTSIVFGTKNVCDDIVGQYFNLRESFMTLFLQHSLASLFLKYLQQVKICSFLDFKNPCIFYFLADHFFLNLKQK
jgi:hypothetical protein